MRQDRHTEHACFIRDGAVHERWHGNYPYDPVEAWAPFMTSLKLMIDAARDQAAPLHDHA